jgi:hypothetical protein
MPPAPTATQTRDDSLTGVACTKASICIATGIASVDARGSELREMSFEVRLVDRAHHWSSRPLLLPGFYSTIGSVLRAALFGVVAAPGATRVTIDRIS